MNPVSSSNVPRSGSFGALLVAAIVLASGCGDDGDGSESGATEAATAVPMTGTATEDPSTTADEPTTTTDDATTDEPTTTGSSAVAYADIQKIWTARCVLGCHMPGGSGAMQTNLDLSDGVSHAQLVDVPSSQAPALPRVSPGDLEGSYLWHKLKNTQIDVNGTGFQMPAGGLADADLTIVEKWIVDGAQP